jgi:signal transduction histidine kinase
MKMTQTIYNNQHLVLEIALLHERKRIAHHLHNEIGGLLCTAKMQLNAFLQQPSLFTPEKHKQLSCLIDTAAQEVRRLAYKVKENRSGFDFSDSIHALLVLLHAENRTHYVSNILQNIKFKNDQQAYAVFTILRELLYNVRKHACATSCTLIIRQCANLLSVRVSDNGKGCEGANIQAGLGLQSIKIALSEMQGSLKIFSKPEAGTVVKCIIKLS